jgi:hypothetical protein
LVEDLRGNAFVGEFGMTIVFNNMQMGIGMIMPAMPVKKK